MTPVLYDMPASNNGARCRVIIYKKRLESDILIKPPSDLGGLKSEQYLALNPQGKMPLLVTEHGNIPESDTIARYLVDRFSSKAPSFIPSTLEARMRSDLLCRLHDMYITTIQGCMYNAEPPFGRFGSRAAALAELRQQLKHLLEHVDEAGPYLTGKELSLADATVFPTIIFIEHMLPKFIDGETWDPEAVLGKKMLRWYRWIQSDPSFKAVCKEITEALAGEEVNERWKNILHAGLRDNDAPTIFDRIIQRQIPSEVVMEDEDVLVFKDIHPQAPLHLLIIPKRRDGLTQLRFASADHQELLGKMLLTAGKIAKEQNLRGYRLVINDGSDAQQSVFHLHMHLLSGRQMRWPPG
uniref:HIT domain-containing protein n=1 Tax=Hanusia phi TaxID=3032 RepID=A0A7S0ES07_9CRYP